MDFIERITEGINTIPKLPLKIRTGMLSVNESLVVNPLPGGTVSQAYMDGSKDVNLIFEIAFKSKDGEKANDVLWQINNYLDLLENLVSKDGSFAFNQITVTGKPYSDDYGEQGFLIFCLNFTASITTYKERK